MTFTTMSRTRGQRNVKLEWLATELDVTYVEAQRYFTEDVERQCVTIYRQCKCLLANEDILTSNTMPCEKIGKWFDSILASMGRDIISKLVLISDVGAKFILLLFDPIFELAGSYSSKPREVFERCVQKCMIQNSALH